MSKKAKKKTILYATIPACLAKVEDVSRVSEERHDVSQAVIWETHEASIREATVRLQEKLLQLFPHLQQGIDSLTFLERAS